uniref:Uncharacterized protein n=1 Tax=Physcomitrium patens TaxID=3218 RepID=A9TMP1_PHYPA|nr:hypothetical protein PHYPA_005589 [Physcomitrium patens]
MRDPRPQLPAQDTRIRFPACEQSKQGIKRAGEGGRGRWMAGSRRRQCIGAATYLYNPSSVTRLMHQLQKEDRTGGEVIAFHAIAILLSTRLLGSRLPAPTKLLVPLRSLKEPRGKSVLPPLRSLRIGARPESALGWSSEAGLLSIITTMLRPPSIGCNASVEPEHRHLGNLSGFSAVPRALAVGARRRVHFHGRRQTTSWAQHRLRPGRWVPRVDQGRSPVQCSRLPFKWTSTPSTLVSLPSSSSSLGSIRTHFNHPAHAHAKVPEPNHTKTPKLSNKQVNKSNPDAWPPSLQPSSPSVLHLRRATEN